MGKEFIDADGKVVANPGVTTVVGILFHDVDVTYGPQPSALIVHGLSMMTGSL